jgi:hypothetical protein
MTSGKDSIRRYLGYGGVDHRQRTLDEALAWDDEVLENTHDYIQWWFPLDEPSNFNRHAPVASRAEFEELQGDEPVMAGVELAMHRILRFYGLRLEPSGAIAKAEEWNLRSQNWAFRQSHNDLRITRILKSLCLLGHRAQAEALLAFLEAIVKERRDPSGQVALRFWRDALL